MYECNETITVLNHKYDPTTGLDEWIPTVIQGVSWFDTIAATVTQSGLKTANTATIRIPVDADTGGRSYVTPAEYKAAGSVLGVYTLARGDIVVKATITERITPAQAKDLYEDTLTIRAVTDSTGRRNAPHRKVVGA